MARLRGTLMIGGLLAALVLAPGARAADGRIVFSGMIVEPTCAVRADHIAWLASEAQVAGTGLSRAGCGQADTGTRYDLAVSTLAGPQVNELLSYFAGYTQAVGATARLVTQTYE